MASAYNILSSIGLGDVAAVLVIISIFVDISPIKLNPLKWIANKFGLYFNHAIEDKIDDFGSSMAEKIDDLEVQIDNRLDSLEDQVTDLKTEQQKIAETQLKQERDLDITEINRLKAGILDFSNRLSRQMTFSAEEYHTVIDQHTEYEKRIAKYPDLSNGKIDIEYNFIINHYEKHKDDGEFMF